MVITDTVSNLDPTRIRVALVPIGEIDAGTVDEFASLVHDALCAGAHEIDLDLSSVTFMDTEALRVLENAREMLEHVDGHLCLRNPQPAVHRLLELTAFLTD